MKTWIHMCAVLILASQMTGCGGGNAKSAAQSNTPEQSSPRAEQIAAAQPDAPTAPGEEFTQDALLDTFNAAQTLWALNAPANYHYNFKAGGGLKFSFSQPVTIWVRGGKMSRISQGGADVPVDTYSFASIEQLYASMAYTLAKIENLDKGAADGDSMNFTLSGPNGQSEHYFMQFDPLLGFPVASESVGGCCDNGSRMEITEFTIDP
ncbi:MAG TPA: DUF6174 domain-containing protein [Cellvibrionaceae bacterium]|nr:DUF6174 domain-containing protein [Cellvibrionaceae bacterium]